MARRPTTAAQFDDIGEETAAEAVEAPVPSSTQTYASPTPAPVQSVSQAENKAPSIDAAQRQRLMAVVDKWFPSFRRGRCEAERVRAVLVELVQSL